MIQVLYATQTGNSEFYAFQIGRIIQNTIIQSIEDYDVINLPDSQKVIFVISTTGDGDMPNVMNKFWQFLLIKDLPKDSLSKLQFSLFGLGDSSYPKFNYAGRKLRSRLLQLSAKEFIPSSFGDEQHPCGLDTEFIVWIQQLTTICEKRNSIINYIQLKLTDQQIIKQQEKQFIYKNKQRLSAENHDKETYKFIFQCQQKYDCGDILAIKPKNHKKLVQQLFEMMKLKNETYQVEQIIPNQKSKIIPQLIQLEQLFTEYLDISSPPTRYFIYQMSQYAQNEIHIQKLKEMCSQTPEGLEEYYNYVYREKRNVIEVLFDFQPCIIPLNQLVDSLQLIRERQYSISSKYNGQEVSITVALVQYLTAKNRSIKGFCSNYLKNLEQNDCITARIIKGSIQFPKDSNTPIIMVGPGTGVAPFISFIESRIEQGIQNVNSTILFFGTCYKDKEFYYEQFLLNAPIKLFTAFSRDQQQKIYVQHRILENREFIQQQVNQHLDQIMIVIAGTSRKMPSQVEQVFKEILGEKILKQLITKKQYIVECW